MRMALVNTDILNTLKLHIEMALTSDKSEDMSLALQIRIAEIDAGFAAMPKSISSDSVDTFDENKVKDLMNEKKRSATAAVTDRRHQTKARERAVPTRRYLYDPRRTQESPDAIR